VTHFARRQNWTYVTGGGRTYSEIEKMGQAKIVPGQAVWYPGPVANRDGRLGGICRARRIARGALDIPATKSEI
jgi:hypothetical protein